MWTAPVLQEAMREAGSDRLRSYVRPVAAVDADRWPRWGPRREVQTTLRCRAPLGPTECLASWDRSITPSLASQASLPAFAAGRWAPAGEALSHSVCGFCFRGKPLVVSWFDWGAFLRPDHDPRGAPRAAAVKVGRRGGLAARRTASRPRLDGGEHGARLVGSGGCAAITAAPFFGRAGGIVAFAAHHQFPGDARGLVGERHGGELGRLACDQLAQPGRGAASAAAFDLPNHRGGARHQDAAQHRVAGARDHAEPLLAGGGVILGGEPEPGRKIAPRAERLGIGHLDRQQRGADWPDRWNRSEQAALCVTAVEGQEPAIERLQLGLERGI